jgi:hypothetical protein
MNRGKEFEKDRANSFSTNYGATLRAVADLDMISVEGVKNLKIFLPAAADISANDC